MTWFTVIAALCILLSVFTAYLAYPLYSAAVAARPLVGRAVPYSDSSARAQRMLVIGDSTAVGVGASSPNKSVPGLLAAYLSASVENYAKSGARIRDLAGQYSNAQHTTYDTILVQIGANDVVGVGSLSAVRDIFAQDIAKLAALSARVYVLTAGDIGASPIFRWPLSALISYRTRVLREHIIDLCAQHGATYVDIYAAPNVVASDPARYHASDNFHLSDDGYGYWFSLLKTMLR